MAILSSIKSKLDSAEWTEEPYRYFFIKDIFPEDLYKEMLENLPSDKKYKRYNKKYSNRLVHKCDNGFWKDFRESMEKLYPSKSRVQLCRDKPGYSIGPHTDGQKELYTFLFYLTDKIIPDAGTSVYTPKELGFISNGKKHLEFKDFEKVDQAIFMPNSCFGFERSDTSFHGVEPCEEERNLIQLSVYR